MGNCLWLPDLATCYPEAVWPSLSSLQSFIVNAAWQVSAYDLPWEMKTGMCSQCRIEVSSQQMLAFYVLCTKSCCHN